MIAVETRSVERLVPADPSNPASAEARRCKKRVPEGFCKDSWIFVNFPRSLGLGFSGVFELL